MKRLLVGLLLIGVLVSSCGVRSSNLPPYKVTVGDEPIQLVSAPYGVWSGDALTVTIKTAPNITCKVMKGNTATGFLNIPSSSNGETVFNFASISQSAGYDQIIIMAGTSEIQIDVLIY